MLKQIRMVTTFATSLLIVSTSQASLCSLATGSTSLNVCFGQAISPVPANFGNAAIARGDFEDFLKTSGTETFVGKAIGTGNPGVTFGATGVTGTLSGQTVTQRPPPLGQIVTPHSVVVAEPSEGRFGTSGDGVEERYLLVGNGTLTLDFSAEVQAFGFYATDLGDFGGTVVIDLFTANGAQKSLTLNNGTGAALDASLVFWGFVDLQTSYKQVRFTFTEPRDGIGFDDLTVGTLNDVPLPTPEPASLALVGAALAGGAFARRRKLRSASAG